MLARRLMQALRHRFWAEDFRHGLDACRDIGRRTGDVRVVFDVGANIGQSAADFAKAFPRARILCFEPVRESFLQLERNTRDIGRVTCVPRALGPARGSAPMQVGAKSVTNSIVDPANPDADPDGEPLRFVDVDTLDRFCEAEAIERIDFLKIDTEGYDLKVLQGAPSLLADQRISFIQVEAGMSPANRKHVPFAEFTGLLEPLGYAVFGIYDQTPEWSGEARLRFCNPVFIADREMHRLGRKPIRSSANGLRFRHPSGRAAA